VPTALLMNAGNIAGGGGPPAVEPSGFILPIRRRRRFRAWWLAWLPLLEAVMRQVRA